MYNLQKVFFNQNKNYNKGDFINGWKYLNGWKSWEPIEKNLGP